MPCPQWCWGSSSGPGWPDRSTRLRPAPNPQVPQGYNYRAEVRKLIPQLQVLDELPAAHTGLLASRKLDQDWLLVKEAIKEGCILDSLLPGTGTCNHVLGPRAGATPPGLRTSPSPRRGCTLVPLAGRLLCPFSDLTPCSQSPAHTPPGQDTLPGSSLGAGLPHHLHREGRNLPPRGSGPQAH